MVRKTTRQPSASAYPMKKFKISVVHRFGPYKTTEQVKAVRAGIKSKVSNIKFSNPSKTASGFRFTGEIVYIKRVAAPLIAVTNAARKSAPNAKVVVKTV